MVRQKGQSITSANCGSTLMLVFVSHKVTKAQRVPNGSRLFVSLCETKNHAYNKLPSCRTFI